MFQKVIVVTGTMWVPRSRGALSGTLLVLLGLWGALIPFVGPYFDYAYTPGNTWDYTAGRLIFEILPGAGAVLGGLLVLGSANRAVAMLGLVGRVKRSVVRARRSALGAVGEPDGR
jgi:hypothetical protein